MKTVYIPFMINICWPDGAGFEATLNQDGSWTMRGDAAEALRYAREHMDAHTLCLLEQLIEQRPPNNPSADNHRPMSFEQMQQVMNASPVLAPCRALRLALLRQPGHA